jgi:hypothetical protein
MQPCIAQPETGRGLDRAGVLCLQFSLIMLGYSVPYSGTFDRATKDAVTYYQALHPPLVADGRAGMNTLASLGIDGAAPIYRSEAAPTATGTTVAGTTAGRVGTGVALGGATACVADANIDAYERGQSVACLQRRLTVLGQYRGSISGLHDQATQDALRAYQKATPPLTADGVGGTRTLAALGIWSEPHGQRRSSHRTGRSRRRCRTSRTGCSLPTASALRQSHRLHGERGRRDRCGVSDRRGRFGHTAVGGLHRLS